jgi:hypothetical protein
MTTFIIVLLIIIVITEYFNIKLLRNWKLRSYEVMEALFLNIALMISFATYTLLFYDILILISTILQIIIVIVLFIDMIRLKL